MKQIDLFGILCRAIEQKMFGPDSKAKWHYHHIMLAFFHIAIHTKKYNPLAESYRLADSKDYEVMRKREYRPMRPRKGYSTWIRHSTPVECSCLKCDAKAKTLYRPHPSCLGLDPGGCPLNY